MSQQLNWILSGLCGMGLHFRMDGFRLIYLGIAVLMWSVSGIFSREYMAHYANRARYYRFYWATFAATAGVFLSADLYTTFIFFEIMSLTSYVWVAFDESPESLRAGATYLAVAIIGGLVMLMGLFWLYNLCHTLEFDALADAAQHILLSGSKAERGQLYAAGACLLFGFGAKAGCFPLHIWLPKAHPVAPAPASALLSGILTKAGIFGVILLSCRMFAGNTQWGLLIVGLGLITMFWGAFLALFSVNLKRTLACSSVSQIGFILVGIGMSCLLRAAGESAELAVRGIFLHMMNHSLFKLVLFLCAGTVFMNLHKLDLNDIRGFGRKKPLLHFSFLMGALGISGMPMWSGYVSKTLLHEAIVEYTHAEELWGSAAIWHGAEWIFLITGGMTVAYMLKLYIALFIDRHPTRQEEFDRMGSHYIRPSSAAALAFASVIPPILGLTPKLTMDGLAEAAQSFFGREGEFEPISYFSISNLRGALISITIGIVLYVAVIRRLMMRPADPDAKTARYLDRWPEWLDLENRVYRPVLQTILPGFLGTVCHLLDRYLVPFATNAFMQISGAACKFIDRYLISSAVTVFMAISAVVCRALDFLADGVILAGMKTIFKKKEQIRNTSQREKAAKQWPKELLLGGTLIEESFSFGLMLFGIGLCLTLGYLLFVFFQRNS